MRAIAGPVAAVLLLATGGLGAADAHGARYPYVAKVTVGDDQYLWIAVQGNFTVDHGCPERWYARSQHRVTDERTRAQMGIASSSLLARSAVYVWTDDCTPSGYPIMTQLQLEPPLPPPTGGGGGGGGIGNGDDPAQREK